MLSLARDTKGKKKRVYIKSQEENQKRHSYITQQERRARQTMEKAAQQQDETKTKQNKILLWKHKLNKQT